MTLTRVQQCLNVSACSRHHPPWLLPHTGASNANTPSSLVYGTSGMGGSGDSAAPVDGGDDAGDSSNEEALTIAHGALMLVAFVVLMPAAVIMACHKWLYGNQEVWQQGVGDG